MPSTRPEDPTSVNSRKILAGVFESHYIVRFSTSHQEAESEIIQYSLSAVLNCFEMSAEFGPDPWRSDSRSE